MKNQKHEVGISVSHFFHFIFSFKFITPILKFGGKCYLIFWVTIMYQKNWYVKIRKYNLNWNTKKARLVNIAKFV